MKEYIDKEALIKTTKETPFTMSMFLTQEECKGANLARNTFAAIFEVLPAADVVEVVRCKDCKHYNPLDDNRPFSCPLMGEVMKYDFCSKGERKGWDNL